jgi:hypothetical protein
MDEEHQQSFVLLDEMDSHAVAKRMRAGFSLEGPGSLVEPGRQVMAIGSDLVKTALPAMTPTDRPSTVAALPEPRWPG